LDLERSTGEFYSFKKGAGEQLVNVGMYLAIKAIDNVVFFLGNSQSKHATMQHL